MYTNETNASVSLNRRRMFLRITACVHEIN